MYQDRWLHGRATRNGQRECASRYAIIQGFCKREFAGKFSVCDIGANWSYFGLRLAHDFPACFVIGWEFHDFKRKAAHLRANHQARVRLFQRKLTLDDLWALGACSRFDVVLALSVLHHFPNPNDWIEAMRDMGRYVLLELAVSDSRARYAAAVKIPNDARLLGYGESHIRRGAKRPIVVIPGAVR